VVLSVRFLLLNRRLVGLGARALADTVPSRGAAAIFGRLLRQTVAELAPLRYAHARSSEKLEQDVRLGLSNAFHPIALQHLRRMLNGVLQRCVG